MRRLLPAGGLALALVGAIACGGGSPTSASGDGGGSGSGGGGTGGGGGPTATTTITIGADGRVSPANITVSPGARVTFVNNHNRPHDMSSDAHPEHTDCPEINQVGFLLPGQSRTTGNLNTVRRCGFHDHNEPSNAGLIGSITIQ